MPVSMLSEISLIKLNPLNKARMISVRLYEVKDTIWNYRLQVRLRVIGLQKYGNHSARVLDVFWPVLVMGFSLFDPA